MSRERDSFRIVPISKRPLYITNKILPTPIDLQYKAFYDRRSIERLGVISGLNVSKVNGIFFALREDRYSVINSAVGNKFIGQTTIYNEFGQRRNGAGGYNREFIIRHIYIGFYKVY